MMPRRLEQQQETEGSRGEITATPLTYSLKSTRLAFQLNHFHLGVPSHVAYF